MSASYGLTLAGGIITAVGGLVAIVFGGAVTLLTPIIGPSGFFGLIGILAGLWGLIVGGIIAYSATQYSSKEHKKYATVALIFSILGLVTAQGFIIGPLLALIGSAMAYGEKKR